MEFQTRSESTGLLQHGSLELAFQEAKKDKTIWKISFQLPTGERVRLVRTREGEWLYKPLRFRSVVEGMRE